jgi:hypothetical protein
LKWLFFQLHTMLHMLRSLTKFWFFFCFGPTFR